MKDLFKKDITYFLSKVKPTIYVANFKSAFS